MAARAGIDDRIRAAEALRRAVPDAATLAAIRRALRDAVGLVVAAAAKAAAAHRRADLIPDLCAALDRAYDDPIRRDPQCHAKLALVTALAELDHDDAAIWLRAARHVQPEPVWGGRSDSAGPLRIRAAEALVSRGHHAVYALLADLLADGVAEVRSAAARLAGDLGGERAAVLLRLRLQLPDDEPENTGDYAAALLRAAGAEAVPLVAGLLADRDRAGLAALALGASRLTEALPPILAQLEQTLDTDLRLDLISALGMHRSEAAAEALLAVLADADDALARSAAAALRFSRDRPEIAARLETALQRRGWTTETFLPGPSTGS